MAAVADEASRLSNSDWVSIESTMIAFIEINNVCKYCDGVYTACGMADF